MEMHLCNFYNWNLSMMTFYDFFEQFAAMGILAETDIVEIITKIPKTPNPKKTPKNRSPGTKNGPTDPQAPSTPLKDPKPSPETTETKKLVKVAELEKTTRRRLSKNIIRLSLHLCHFLGSNKITCSHSQRQIAYLILVLARKFSGVKTFKNRLLQDFYSVELLEEPFMAALTRLQTEFDEILVTFDFGLEGFDDGMGLESEAFQPFAPFDFVEREYNELGVVVEEHLEDQEKKLRREVVRRRRRKKAALRDAKERNAKGFDVYGTVPARGIADSKKLVSSAQKAENGKSEKMDKIGGVGRAPGMSQRLVERAGGLVRASLDLERQRVTIGGESEIQGLGAIRAGLMKSARMKKPWMGAGELAEVENVYDDRYIGSSGKKQNMAKLDLEAASAGLRASRDDQNTQKSNEGGVDTDRAVRNSKKTNLVLEADLGSKGLQDDQAANRGVEGTKDHPNNSRNGSDPVLIEEGANYSSGTSSPDSEDSMHSELDLDPEEVIGGQSKRKISEQTTTTGLNPPSQVNVNVQQNRPNQAVFGGSSGFEQSKGSRFGDGEQNHEPIPFPDPKKSQNLTFHYNQNQVVFDAPSHTEMIPGPLNASNGHRISSSDPEFPKNLQKIHQQKTQKNSNSGQSGAKNGPREASGNASQLLNPKNDQINKFSEYENNIQFNRTLGSSFSPEVIPSSRSHLTGPIHLQKPQKMAQNESKMNTTSRERASLLRDSYGNPRVDVVDIDIDVDVEASYPSILPKNEAVERNLHKNAWGGQRPYTHKNGDYEAYPRVVEPNQRFKSSIGGSSNKSGDLGAGMGTFSSGLANELRDSSSKNNLFNSGNLARMSPSDSNSGRVVTVEADSALKSLREPLFPNSDQKHQFLTAVGNTELSASPFKRQKQSGGPSQAPEPQKSTKLKKSINSSSSDFESLIDIGDLPRQLREEEDCERKERMQDIYMSQPLDYQLRPVTIEVDMTKERQDSVVKGDNKAIEGGRGEVNSAEVKNGLNLGSWGGEPKRPKIGINEINEVKRVLYKSVEAKNDGSGLLGVVNLDKNPEKSKNSIFENKQLFSMISAEATKQLASEYFDAPKKAQKTAHPPTNPSKYRSVDQNRLTKPKSEDLLKSGFLANAQQNHAPGNLRQLNSSSSRRESSQSGALNSLIQMETGSRLNLNSGSQEASKGYNTLPGTRIDPKIHQVSPEKPKNAKNGNNEQNEISGFQKGQKLLQAALKDGEHPAEENEVKIEINKAKLGFLQSRKRPVGAVLQNFKELQENLVEVDKGAGRKQRRKQKKRYNSPMTQGEWRGLNQPNLGNLGNGANLGVEGANDADSKQERRQRVPIKSVDKAKIRKKPKKTPAVSRHVWKEKLKNQGRFEFKQSAGLVMRTLKLVGDDLEDSSRKSVKKSLNTSKMSKTDSLADSDLSSEIDRIRELPGSSTTREGGFKQLNTYFEGGGAGMSKNPIFGQNEANGHQLGSYLSNRSHEMKLNRQLMLHSRAPLPATKNFHSGDFRRSEVAKKPKNDVSMRSGALNGLEMAKNGDIDISEKDVNAFLRELNQGASGQQRISRNRSDKFGVVQIAQNGQKDQNGQNELKDNFQSRNANFGGPGVAGEVNKPENGINQPQKAYKYSEYLSAGQSQNPQNKPISGHPGRRTCKQSSTSHAQHPLNPHKHRSRSNLHQNRENHEKSKKGSFLVETSRRVSVEAIEGRKHLLSSFVTVDGLLKTSHHSKINLHPKTSQNTQNQVSGRWRPQLLTKPPLEASRHSPGQSSRNLRASSAHENSAIRVIGEIDLGQLTTDRADNGSRRGLQRLSRRQPKRSVDVLNRQIVHGRSYKNIAIDTNLKANTGKSGSVSQKHVLRRPNGPNGNVFGMSNADLIKISQMGVGAIGGFNKENSESQRFYQTMRAPGRALDGHQNFLPFQKVGKNKMRAKSEKQKKNLEKISRVIAQASKDDRRTSLQAKPDTRTHLPPQKAPNGPNQSKMAKNGKNGLSEARSINKKPRKAKTGKNVRYHQNGPKGLGVYLRNVKNMSYLDQDESVLAKNQKSQKSSFIANTRKSSFEVPVGEQIGGSTLKKKLNKGSTKPGGRKSNDWKKSSKMEDLYQKVKQKRERRLKLRQKVQLDQKNVLDSPQPSIEAQKAALGVRGSSHSIDITRDNLGALSGINGLKVPSQASYTMLSKTMGGSELKNGPEGLKTFQRVSRGERLTTFTTVATSGNASAKQSICVQNVQNRGGYGAYYASGAQIGDLGDTSIKARSVKNVPNLGGAGVTAMSMRLVEAEKGKNQPKKSRKSKNGLEQFRAVSRDEFGQPLVGGARGVGSELRKSLDRLTQSKLGRNGLNSSNKISTNFGSNEPSKMNLNNPNEFFRAPKSSVGNQSHLGNDISLQNPKKSNFSRNRNLSQDRLLNLFPGTKTAQNGPQMAFNKQNSIKNLNLSPEGQTATNPKNDIFERLRATNNTTSHQERSRGGSRRRETANQAANTDRGLENPNLRNQQNQPISTVQVPDNVFSKLGGNRRSADFMLEKKFAGIRGLEPKNANRKFGAPGPENGGRKTLGRLGKGGRKARKDISNLGTNFMASGKPNRKNLGFSKKTLGGKKSSKRRLNVISPDPAGHSSYQISSLEPSEIDLNGKNGVFAGVRKSGFKTMNGKISRPQDNQKGSPVGISGLRTTQNAQKGKKKPFEKTRKSSFNRPKILSMDIKKSFDQLNFSSKPPLNHKKMPFSSKPSDININPIPPKPGNSGPKNQLRRSGYITGDINKTLKSLNGPQSGQNQPNQHSKLKPQNPNFKQNRGNQRLFINVGDPSMHQLASQTFGGGFPQAGKLGFQLNTSKPKSTKNGAAGHKSMYKTPHLANLGLKGSAAHQESLKIASKGQHQPGSPKGENGLLRVSNAERASASTSIHPQGSNIQAGNPNVMIRSSFYQVEARSSKIINLDEKRNTEQFGGSFVVKNPRNTQRGPKNGVFNFATSNTSNSTLNRKTLREMTQKLNKSGMGAGMASNHLKNPKIGQIGQISSLGQIGQNGLIGTPQAGLNPANKFNQFSHGKPQAPQHKLTLQSANIPLGTSYFDFSKNKPNLTAGRKSSHIEHQRLLRGTHGQQINSPVQKIRANMERNSQIIKVEDLAGNSVSGLAGSMTNRSYTVNMALSPDQGQKQLRRDEIMQLNTSGGNLQNLQNMDSGGPGQGNKTSRLHYRPKIENLGQRSRREKSRTQLFKAGENPGSGLHRPVFNVNNKAGRVSGTDVRPGIESSSELRRKNASLGFLDNRALVSNLRAVAAGVGSGAVGGTGNHLIQHQRQAHCVAGGLRNSRHVIDGIVDQGLSGRASGAVVSRNEQYGSLKSSKLNLF